MTPMTASAEAAELTLVGIIQTALREVWTSPAEADPRAAWAEVADSDALAELITTTLTDAELDTALYWHAGDAHSGEEVIDSTPAAVALTDGEKRAGARYWEIEDGCADIISATRESAPGPREREIATKIVHQFLESMMTEEGVAPADPERWPEPWASLRKGCQSQIHDAFKERQDQKTRPRTPNADTNALAQPHRSERASETGRVGVLKAIVQMMLEAIYGNSATKPAPAFIEQERASGEVLAVAICKALSAREVATAFEWIAAYHHARRWAREIDWSPIAPWLDAEQLRIARCRELVQDFVDDCTAMAVQIPIHLEPGQSEVETRARIAQDLLIARIAVEAQEGNKPWSWRSMTAGTPSAERVAELPEPWRSLTAAQLSTIAERAETWARERAVARKGPKLH